MDTKRTWAYTEEDLRKIIGEFLNACPEEIQDYLEERSPGHDLTRLQEVKNKVINPVTGQMI